MTEHGVRDRVVIVTGAGQGIGRGIARHLGRHGAKVVVAEWKAHKMQRTVDELTALGVEALGVVCDVQQQASIDAMVAATVARFGRVDGLVNNAQTFRAQAPVEAITTRPGLLMVCTRSLAVIKLPERHASMMILIFTPGTAASTSASHSFNSRGSTVSKRLLSRLR